MQSDSRRKGAAVLLLLLLRRSQGLGVHQCQRTRPRHRPSAGFMSTTSWIGVGAVRGRCDVETQQVPMLDDRQEGIGAFGRWIQRRQYFCFGGLRESGLAGNWRRELKPKQASFVPVPNSSSSHTNRSQSSRAKREDHAQEQEWENNMMYSIERMQGRRSYMEDRDAVWCPKLSESGDSIFAVFDGHAGDECSTYCAKHLLTRVKQELGKNQSVENALKTAFLKVDSEFLEHAKRRHIEDGTTATLALVRRDQKTGTCTDIWVANAGDSRAVLVRARGSTKALSRDHKAETETERIQQMGGFVRNIYGFGRVNGVLAVSRAFGNASLKPVVTAEPEVVHHKVGDRDTFLILATDGLWDEISNEYAGRVLVNSGTHFGVQLLARMSYKLGSYDNITVLGVDLRNVLELPNRSAS